MRNWTLPILVMALHLAAECGLACRLPRTGC